VRRAAWLLGGLLVPAAAIGQGAPAPASANASANPSANASANASSDAPSTAPASAPAGAPGSAGATPAPPCAAAEHRQFDFWLGDWDVTTPDGKAAGRNLVTRIAGGCALHENWVGRSGFTGQSLNAWNARTKRWQQTWLDSSGGRLDLEGGWRDGAMVLEGREPHPRTAGTTLRHRIRWTPHADGSVRQHWQTSEDDGRTWTTAFDGRYTRRR